MVNLLVKDFFIHKIMLLGMLAGIFLYMLLDVSVIRVGILFTLAIVMHIFASDEKKSIQTLLSSLPYTRREIVSSRYLSAITVALLVIAVIAISDYAVNQQIPDWKQFLLVAGMAMLAFSFYFPFSYRFASKYLLIALIGAFLIYLLVIRFIVSDLNDLIRSMTTNILELNDMQLWIGAGILIILLYILSWMVSVRIYEKKVF